MDAIGHCQSSQPDNTVSAIPDHITEAQGRVSISSDLLHLSPHLLDDETATPPKITARKVKIESNKKQKQNGQAVFFGQNVSYPVIMQLWRSIEFLGIGTVFVTKEFEEWFNQNSFLRGNGYKWLDIKTFTSSRQDELLDMFSSSECEVIGRSHERKITATNITSQLVIPREKPIILFISGSSNEPHLLDRSLMNLSNIMIAKLASEPQSSNYSLKNCQVMLHCDTLNGQNVSRPKASRSAFKKQAGKLLSPDHKHPEKTRTNGTILILEEVFDYENMLNIVFLCCDLEMPELHYISQHEERHALMKQALQSSGCPVSVSFYKSSQACISELKAQGYTVYCSSLEETAQSAFEIKAPSKCAVILGNEVKGLSQQAQDMSDKKTTIPRKGLTESLNVSAAASILAYQLRS